MGFSSTLRIMDSRKLQSTALDHALPDGDESLHTAVHAHSQGMVRTSYLLNPTERFEKGTEMLYQGRSVDTAALPLDPIRDAAEMQQMRMQESKVIHSLHEATQARKRSNREVNARQAIRSQFRNALIYSILEGRDPAFTKSLLTNMPTNTRHYPYFNVFILNYLVSQQDILDIAKKDLMECDTLKKFCQNIMSALKAFNRTALTLNNRGESGKFFAISVPATSLPKRRRPQPSSASPSTSDSSSSSDVSVAADSPIKSRKPQPSSSSVPATSLLKRSRPQPSSDSSSTSDVSVTANSPIIRRKPQPSSDSSSTSDDDE